MSGIVSSHYDFAKGTSNSKGGKGAPDWHSLPTSVDESKGISKGAPGKGQRQSANGSGKGGTCSGEGQSAGARQSATSWLGKGLQGAQDADKTMKKGPGIGKGKGKTMPIQDPNAILHKFFSFVWRTPYRQRAMILNKQNN